MKILVNALVGATVAVLSFSACSSSKQSTSATKQDKVLIFSKTRGYRHKSIEPGIAAIQKLGAENNFQVYATEDSSKFVYDTLKQYKAVIFLNPTGKGLFNADQQKGFQEYIHKGGGYVGIHAATDCLYDWEWYGKLAGAYFLKHPAIQKAKLFLTDSSHISTKHLQSPWWHTDEWYNFKSFNKDVTVLIKVDETSYNGGSMNNDHPISWYHNFEGGRAFYTALGHTEEDFNSDTLYLQHLLGGIKYAMGRKK
ncbi:MAG: ThuA domain-containing protein [Filimonas sp.]|nr:ThuA domain-containing protein [Filimonas sp.]